MTCMTSNESRLSLPGAYCQGNDMSATPSSLVDTYQQDGVVDPSHHSHSDNKLAIISPIFFSPSVSPGSLRTSLPGTWVDTSPYQIQQENKENDYTHSNTLQQLQQQQQQRPYHRHQQQKGVEIPISSSTAPSTTAITTDNTPLSPSSSSAVLDHVDMNHLRQTIASLRERAEQLEQTDLVVKKSIEIVAKKRLLAERRQYAQWDWCDQPGGIGKTEQELRYDRCSDSAATVGGDGGNGGNSSVPILDDIDDGTETDRSDDDNHDEQHYEGCGGDWEWID